LSSITNSVKSRSMAALRDGAAIGPEVRCAEVKESLYLTSRFSLEGLYPKYEL